MEGQIPDFETPVHRALTELASVTGLGSSGDYSLTTMGSKP